MSCLPVYWAYIASKLLPLVCAATNMKMVKEVNICSCRAIYITQILSYAGQVKRPGSFEQGSVGSSPTVPTKISSNICKVPGIRIAKSEIVVLQDQGQLLVSTHKEGRLLLQSAISLSLSVLCLWKCIKGGGYWPVLKQTQIYPFWAFPQLFRN